MKTKLTLSLADDQLLLEVIRPRDGVRNWLAALLRRTGSRAPTSTGGAVCHVRSIGNCGPDHLPSQLDQLFETLQDSLMADSLAGSDLEVLLGLDHARIGLMVLGGDAATYPDSAVVANYARAWVRQMLHLDPAGQIVRQQILADSDKVLISCVDRGLFEALRQFCASHALRFRSCRPAILTAIADQKLGPNAAEEAKCRTVVWTEVAAAKPRSSLVQLLRFERGQLMAAWRGWVPAPSRLEDADVQLEGAIRRFEIRYGAKPDESQRRVQWPPSPRHPEHAH